VSEAWQRRMNVWGCDSECEKHLTMSSSDDQEKQGGMAKNDRKRTSYNRSRSEDRSGSCHKKRRAGSEKKEKINNAVRGKKVVIIGREKKTAKNILFLFSEVYYKEDPSTVGADVQVLFNKKLKPLSDFLLLQIKGTEAKKENETRGSDYKQQSNIKKGKSNT